MDERNDVVNRVQRILDRLEAWMPAHEPPADWTEAAAWSWQRRGNTGQLIPVRRPHRLQLEDLLSIDTPKAELTRNTEQFVAGRPANNALLWGARGTGKSSLVKALLNAYADRGLRLIQVQPDDLTSLMEIVDRLVDRPERFIVFCDDLSFAADDPRYKTLKAVLDGDLNTLPENCLVVATSNRRHLMPETMADNQAGHRVGDEIHPGEAVEEKISLSERFGLWLSFYPFDQETYLAIVRHWLSHLGVSEVEDETLRRAALQWALARGARNGRVAWQFARDWAGRC